MTIMMITIMIIIIIIIIIKRYIKSKSSMCLKSVPWTLEEFYFNRGLQRPYNSTCIILQKTINGFLCLIVVFLKVKHIS